MLSVSLAGLSTPAYAHVEEVTTKTGGPKIKIGLQPREAESFWYGSQKYDGLGKHGSAPNHAAASFDNASGNAVVHAAGTYAIYWDPQDYYHGDWQGLIDEFLANIGTAGNQLASVFAVDEQYTDKTNKPAAAYSTFRGAYTDTHPYPATNGCTDPRSLEFGVPFLEGTITPVCVTAVQVQAEIERFVKQREEEHDTLPKGMGTIFYLLTPPGVTVCMNEGGPGGHCSDFKGTPIEISRYEEAQKRLPEEMEIYEGELVTYEKALSKYENEVLQYEEAVVKYGEAVLRYEEEQKIYEKNKAKDKTEEVRDTETEPVKPTAPVAPVAPIAPFKPVPPKEPEGYPTYKKSFCSYHAAIGSGTSTILYAMIPWTAGGDGDYHLTSRDETGGFACQDGGFEPNEEELEVKEREPTETAKARNELEESSKAAKEPAEEEKERHTTKPVDQEPNQLGDTRSSDGSYDVGLADLIINQIAVEQQNIVTDPLLNAWQDSEGNEMTDECRNFFAPSTGSALANAKTLAGTLANDTLSAGSYYLNTGFSLAGLSTVHPGVEYPGLPYPAASPCPGGVNFEPKFTAPSTVKGGEVVGFDGMESDISLNSAVGFSAAGKEQPNYATYTWNFGDGTPQVSGYAPGAPACETPWLSPCAASEYHTYKYSGTYNITLTVKDVGGNLDSVTHSVTVVEGEPRPEEKGSDVSGPSGTPGSPGASGSSASGSASASSSSVGASSASTGTTTKPPVPGPVATQAVLSSSLSKTLSRGLLVRYSVSQQATGHFEVLLAASIAHSLGLHLPLATGLPTGTPPQVVLAKALLVTTKAGRNTLKIQFGKVTAKRLRRLHKVSLTLRLNLRNAGGGTTTVLSKLTLH